jgi:predicted dehydrogenase
MSLRVGILGAGWAADRHVRAAQTAGLEVTAIASADVTRADAFASRLDIPCVHDSWSEVCADPNVDMVVIATPNALHHEQAMCALAADKHVLVEKPMALTSADGRAMATAARASGLTLAVGHMWRYREEVLRLRREIADGAFGEIVRTHGYGVHAGWGPGGWFTSPELAGGGALIDMGIHAIDTARFLLGDPAPRRVQASIGLGRFGDYPVDDDGLVIVDWDNGTRSLIEFGWWQPRLGGLEAETEVLGKGGSARIWPQPIPPPEGYEHCTIPMYAAQIADVAACCMSGATPRASAEVGLVALEIVEAAYAAAAG